MPAMHVAIIASKQGGKTYYSKLLRRSLKPLPEIPAGSSAASRVPIPRPKP